MVTLATEKLETHAGMLVPVNDMNFDETSDDWLIKIGVFHGVRVDVTFKYLPDRHTHR